MHEWRSNVSGRTGWVWTSALLSLWLQGSAVNGGEPEANARPANATTNVTPAGEGSGETEVDESGKPRPRPMREMRRGPEGRPQPPELNLTPEMLGRAREILRDYFYDNKEMLALVDQAGEKPELLQRLIKRQPELPGQLMRLAFLKNEDETLYRLRLDDLRAERKTLELVKDYHAAVSDGKQEEVTRLQGAVRDQVKAHFEIRQKAREAEIARLERRLADLRKQLEGRKSNSASLLDQRVKELLGKDAQAEW